LLAIGCEAVVKNGFTTEGKPFRLYREQAHSYRNKLSNSNSYFLMSALKQREAAKAICLTRPLRSPRNLGQLPQNPCDP